MKSSLPLEAEASRGKTQAVAVHLLRYLLTVLAVMAALYAIPLLLVRSAFYARWNPSFYARPLDFAYNTAGVNADVIIFGDSTALLGIDPSKISAALGVKVLNLPNTLASLSVDDDLPLRRYMAANKPPRLIVFYFAPWDFDYGHLHLNAALIYEGQELLARHGTKREILAYIRTHPLDTIAFPLRFYAAAWKSIEDRTPYRYQAGQLAATLGHVDNLDATHLIEPCKIPQLALDNIRFDWVRALGDKYRSKDTQILFFVAPVPSCSNVAAVIDRPYGELPAAPPTVVSPSYFGNSALYLHPRQSSVPFITRNLTDALRPLLSEDSPDRPR